SLGLAPGSESVKVASTTLMNARPATAATGCATRSSGSAVLVSAKLAAVVTPATEAVTGYEPSRGVAAGGTRAGPSGRGAAGEPVKVAEAPEAGAVNVTVTPGTGLPRASVTTTTSGAVKPVATVTVWPEPETTMTDAAAGVLVSAKPVAVVT